MKRVLALDPGNKVGWAAADVHDDGHWERLEHGILPLKDMALGAHQRLNVTDNDGTTWSLYDVVVIEDWILRGDKAQAMVGSTFPSSQFIGMVQLSCWLAGVPLVRQQATAQGQQAQRSLQRLNPELWEATVGPGLQLAHDDSHDMSAILHLWTWTMKNTTMEAYCDGR